MFTVVYAMYSSDKETGKVQFSEVARLLIQNNVRTSFNEPLHQGEVCYEQRLMTVIYEMFSTNKIVYITTKTSVYVVSRLHTLVKTFQETTALSTSLYLIYFSSILHSCLPF